MEISVQTKTGLSPPRVEIIIPDWNLNITDMKAQQYMVGRQRTGTWLM